MNKLLVFLFTIISFPSLIAQNTEGVEYDWLLRPSDNYWNIGTLSKSRFLATTRKGESYNTIYQSVLIDERGRIIAKLSSESTSFPKVEIEKFSEGLAMIAYKSFGSEDLKYGFINENGEIVVEPTFSKPLDMGYGELIKSFNFKDGVAKVYQNGKYGLIDKYGRYILRSEFDAISAFSEDLALVKQNGKYGYINKQGNFRIPLQYQSAQSFSDGLAKVCDNENCGYIDKNGNIAIELKYNKQDIALGAFSEGLASYRVKNSKLGYIDKSGNIAIPLQFDADESGKKFSEGLAVVKQNNKYGYIDKNGSFIISPRFKSANAFENGIASVWTLDGTFIDIDRNGNTIKAESEKMNSSDYDVFMDDFFYGTFNKKGTNEKEGILDNKYNVLVTPQFHKVYSENIINGVAVVEARKKQYGIIKIKQTQPIVVDKPIITWEYPTNNIVSPFSTQNLKACIKSKSKITDVSLYIDNQLLKVRDFEIQPVNSNCDYHFEKQIQLNKMNQPITIALTATNEGGTTTTSRTIEIQQTNTKVGKYKALLIAEQDYQDPQINKLYKPISDAAELENVLTDKYGFEIIPLVKNPKKKDIVDALIALRTTTNDNDNVLIYYSGHGKMDGDEGFWLPSDVSKNDQSSWLSTKDISSYIKRIPSKHTLVVVDACYGGVLILKDDADEKACEVKGSFTSRNAITSGTKEVVPDESIFMKYMVKKLAENTQSCLPADELCHSLEKPVINNSPIKQIPKYGSIPSTGDEGGSFIFMLKK